MEETDWDNLGFDFFDFDTDNIFTTGEVEEVKNSTTENGDTWMVNLGQLLMNDNIAIDNDNGIQNDDILDVLLDSPCDQNQPQLQSEPEPDLQVLDASTSPNNTFTTSNNNSPSSNIDEVDADDDPATKKRKRQLRNRDAAMRSRERKKTYVKDLEIKSRYLESECRRLGRLLQCCYAENQMLRISLQSGTTFGNVMAKPESAVLLLESLLLGSLVWFMALMCLLPLPRLHELSQDAVALGSENRENLESTVPRGKEPMPIDLWLPLSFLRSKRCKASRTKMKYDFDCAKVLC